MLDYVCCSPYTFELAGWRCLLNTAGCLAPASHLCCVERRLQS